MRLIKVLSVCLSYILYMQLIIFVKTYNILCSALRKSYEKSIDILLTGVL